MFNDVHDKVAALRCPYQSRHRAAMTVTTVNDEAAVLCQSLVHELACGHPLTLRPLDDALVAEE